MSESHQTPCNNLRTFETDLNVMKTSMAVCVAKIEGATASLAGSAAMIQKEADLLAEVRIKVENHDVKLDNGQKRFDRYNLIIWGLMVSYVSLVMGLIAILGPELLKYAKVPL